MDTTTLIPLIKRFNAELHSDTFLSQHSQEHKRRSANAISLFQIDKLETVSKSDLITFLKDTDAWYGVRSGEQFWDRLFGASEENLSDVRKTFQDIVTEGEIGLTPHSVKALGDSLKGIGLAFLSEIFSLRFPEKYWMWNGPVREFFKKHEINIKGELPRGKKTDDGEEYFVVGAHMLDLQRAISREMGKPVDFLLTDLFFYWSNKLDVIPPPPPPPLEHNFNGFSKESFQFLKELKKNNNDEWMHVKGDANLNRFRNLVDAPLRSLFEALVPSINRLDPRMETEVKARKILALIRKRFPDAEGPYHDYLWGAFYRKGRTRQTDCQLFIAIYPDYLYAGLYFVGAGATEILKNFRSNLSAFPEIFFDLVNKLPEDFMLRYRIDTNWIEKEVPVVTREKDLDAILNAKELELVRYFNESNPVLYSDKLVGNIGQVFESLHPLFIFTTANVESIPDIFTDEEEDEGEVTESLYSQEDLIRDTYLTKEYYENLNYLLKEKGQIILFGPPGTGKTWIAQKYARYWVDQAEELGGIVKTVQFHPSYSYEEFIEGIRPESVDWPDGTKQISYPVKPGIFRRFCDYASGNPKRRYVMIIDEINRGELPRILGELLYLLEYRDQSIELPYSGKQGEFSIPHNVFLIGTMNTADRSIALVDHALRRRFYFIPLKPDLEILRSYLQENNPEMIWVVDLLQELNSKLEEDAKIDWTLQIGHSHFMKKDLGDAMLNLIWEYSIIPTLEEYFYRKDHKYLDAFKLETLKEALGK